MIGPVQHSRCSRCCIATAVIGAAALITVVALAAIYHKQIPTYAKKWSASFINSPLYVQLPIAGAVSMILTYLLLLGGGRLIDWCRNGDVPGGLKGPDHKDEAKLT